MARPLRRQFPGVIDHVMSRGIERMPHRMTQRGNRRQPAFPGDDDDAAYLELMGKWCNGISKEVRFLMHRSKLETRTAVILALPSTGAIRCQAE